LVIDIFLDVIKKGAYQAKNAKSHQAIILWGDGFFIVQLVFQNVTGLEATLWKRLWNIK
jgi:hypothetical protein